MTFSFGAGVRDSLSNLAASLGTGRDKAAHDAFTVFDLGRAQIEAMYRGDWLARKVVDIVPYDSVRAWRSWSGHRADVARFEAAERRLGLRKTVQRAMTLGRLYGGGAILIGDGETDIARLARPLDPRLPKDGLLYLHALSRWQLGVSALDLNPLSPWCGEPKFYTLSSPGLPPLELHPSRVVRFLGNPLPDPSHAGALWSDSVLQSLYDAVHAAALSLAGATSLLHEAKVDVVTVPNLSEHLSSAETTAQLSARFAYAAAMKSMNNLLLLGDGESWSRQSVDFAGLPEMARTFLQVAAGAADIPVTRLLGQSPSGLSATGESDVRNYYDMIAARQELDLRPQLERLDRLICWSEDIDEGALSFAFRPLWQLDEPAKAALALSRAQATQVYAGLKLWPDAVMAKLAEAQLMADGTYPNAAAVFAEAGALASTSIGPTFDYDPNELRNLTDPGKKGQWMAREGGGTASDPDVHLTLLAAEDPDPTPEEQEEELRKQLEEREDPQRYFRQRFEQNGRIRLPPRPGGSGVPTVKLAPTGGAEVPAASSAPEPSADPEPTSSPNNPKFQATTPQTQRLKAPAVPSARPSGLGPAGAEPDDVTRGRLFNAAREALKIVDPKNPALNLSIAPGALPTDADLESIKGALRKAKVAAWRDLDSRLEMGSPSAPSRIPPRPALEGYYGNPQSPGPFADALYPEIEAGPEGVAIEIKPPEKVKRSEEGDPEAIKSPKAFNRGTDYETKIFQMFNLDKPDRTWEERKLRPDATTSDAAVEIKFTDDFRRSMYNPARRSRFADREVSESIEQAMKYANDDPPRKLVYYTNDWGLAEYYTRAFRGVGLSSFRFIVVPAIRSSEDEKPE